MYYDDINHSRCLHWPLTTIMITTMNCIHIMKYSKCIRRPQHPHENTSIPNALDEFNWNYSIKISNRNPLRHIEIIGLLFASRVQILSSSIAVIIVPFAPTYITYHLSGVGGDAKWDRTKYGRKNLNVKMAQLVRMKIRDGPKGHLETSGLQLFMPKFIWH